MADIVNLHRVKKQRAKTEAAATAAQNRVRFGRTPAQKREDAAQDAKRRALLDGARRDEATDG